MATIELIVYENPKYINRRDLGPFSAMWKINKA